MKKLFKPASLLLYMLSLSVFFLMGASYAGISGAAEGQGLAGGAIVFGYGVVFGALSFVAAIFMAYYAKKKTVIIANRVLAIVLALALGVFIYRFNNQ